MNQGATLKNLPSLKKSPEKGKDDKFVMGKDDRFTVQDSGIKKQFIEGKQVLCRLLKYTWIISHITSTKLMSVSHRYV